MLAVTCRATSPTTKGGRRRDAHPVGEVGDLVDGAVGDVEDGELVGAHAGDHVVRAHGVARRRSATETSSPSVISGPVAVDQLLEAVEVHDEHGDEGIGVGEPVEGLVEPVAEQGPVRGGG